MDEAQAIEIGRRIRRARERLGLNQNQFAAQSGFNPNVLSRLERGAQNMNLQTLFRIAAALDMHPSQLLEGV